MPRYCLCLLLLVAFGCAAPPEEPAIDLQAERGALMKADEAFFESHENVDQFLKALAENAIFMPDKAPMARGDSIRTTWEQLISMPGFKLEWQATSAEAAEAGDMGFTIGTYELTVEENGTPMVTVGKYVTIWKKQPDGAWKVAVDCFNGDGPPTEA